MTPREYEKCVSDYFKEQGYEVELTPQSNDYGVDVFARKGDEKIAIQVKMYGNSSRKVNRQMIMNLHGAKDYFGCTHGVLATNGEVMPDAVEVAQELGIEILKIQENTSDLNDLQETTDEMGNMRNEESDKIHAFDDIWKNYVMPLEGKVLYNSKGMNRILKVDWTGVRRITSTGKEGTIPIESFKMAVDKLLEDGAVTRDYINQNSSRVSSGIVLILSQVPFFKMEKDPLRLVFQRPEE